MSHRSQQTFRAHLDLLCYIVKVLLVHNKGCKRGKSVDAALRMKQAVTLIQITLYQVKLQFCKQASAQCRAVTVCK